MEKAEQNIEESFAILPWSEGDDEKYKDVEKDESEIKEIKDFVKQSLNFN